MKMTEAFSSKDLRKRLFDLLDSMDFNDAPENNSFANQFGSRPMQNDNLKENGAAPGKLSAKVPVVKAIPLSFPVVEVNYTLRERVPEPIGLVRRAILRALIEFGPCDSDFIDGLLFIGSDIVERTLVEFAKSIPDLKRTGSIYEAGPQCIQILQDDRFTRHVTHERKFLVNGVTDSLLPLDFWRQHWGLRLIPDPANPAGPMCTESGTPTSITAKICDRTATGRVHLQNLLRDGDAKSRERFGLPPGACELVDEQPAMRVAWVLGFLMIRSDNSIDLMTARRDPVKLLVGITNPREYARHVLQGIALKNLNVDTSKQPDEKWENQWPDGTKIVPGKRHGEVMVTLIDPNRLLRLDSESDSKNISARRMLEQGRYWNPYTFKIFRIIPGDMNTAKSVVLIRGICELRSMLRTMEPSLSSSQPVKLTEWWHNFQAAFATQEEIRLPDIIVTLDELVRVADNVKDTDFQDKLERILR